MFSGFVVFFCSLRFLCYRFSRSFVVLFSRLSFLLCSWFCRGFVVFFVMGGLGSSAVGSSRCLSGAYCVSSESGRRETHSSGNDQS